MTGFADQYLDRLTEMEECITCTKPTQSHLILLEYNPEEERIEALDPGEVVGELHAADAFGLVCHECYEQYDGDAEAVAAEYDSRLEEIAEAVDRQKQDIMKVAEGDDGEDA